MAGVISTTLIGLVLMIRYSDSLYLEGHLDTSQARLLKSVVH